MKLSVLSSIVAGALLLNIGVPALAAGTVTDLYAGWDSDLNKFVDKGGAVNYRSWKQNPGGLNASLESVSKFTAAEYALLSKESKLTFWINLYNAVTVKQILEHYPIRRSGLNLYPDNSIRQIDGVWDKYRVRAAGREVTLSEIENKILRGEIKDPLIHFAINCASRSCPKLANRAYKSESVYRDMEAAARDFVGDSQKNRINEQEKKVELSRIFDWFGDDFKDRGDTGALPGRSAKESAAIRFISKYVDEPRKEFLQANRFSIGFLQYDWSLNEQGRTK